jgi:hypothetical protein
MTYIQIYRHISRFCGSIMQWWRPFIILILFARIFLIYEMHTSLHPIITATVVTTRHHTAIDVSNNNSKVLTIASWNLRVPFPPDLQLHLLWAERRDLIISAIHQHQPHFLAVQEDCYFWNSDILHHTTIDTHDITTKTTSLSDKYHQYGLFNRNGESCPSSN